MSQSRRADRVEAIYVVVPAHDEAELLPGALASLKAAIDYTRQEQEHLYVGLAIVLDACTDASYRICVDAGVDVIEVSYRNVGAARACGTARARRTTADRRIATAQVWIAHTDADSRVPVDWLTDQIEVAEAGFDVVLGRVEPDGTAIEAVVAKWHTFHPPGHVGVHGANLGVRLSADDAVGGFAHLSEREDLDLVKRLLADGAREGAARRPVMTSSRLAGRTAGGFAGYLAGLAADLTPKCTSITRTDGSVERVG